MEKIITYKMKDYSINNLKNIGYHFNKKLSDNENKYYSIRFPAVKYNYNTSIEGEITVNIEDGTIDEEVIVQAGYTKFQSSKMRILDLVSREQLEQFQNEANLIITHGGVGSIISSIERGKKVIAIPRLHEYEEHVNNHQIEIVRNFNEKGYIIGIEKVEDLKYALEKIKNFKPVKYEINNRLMLKTIEEFIDKI